MHQDQAVETQSKSQPVQTQKRQKPNSTVLLIDDQLFLLLAMESQFSEAGVVCEQRQSGVTALELITALE